MNSTQNITGGKFSIKRVSAVLLTVFLVFGGISALMVFLQVMPNELNAGVNREPYTESFSLELGEGDDLMLSLSGVNITVERCDGDTLLAEFEGSYNKDASANGRIEASRTGRRTTITQPPESTTQFVFIGINPDTADLRGTLRVFVPDRKLKSAEFKTFSGNITVSDIIAEDITVSSSSGNVETNSVLAERGLTANTFSGNIRMLSDTVSGAFSVNTSSGNIYCEDSRLKSAVAETFSGNVSITNTALEDTKVSTSSGNVELSLTQHGNVNCETFSGDVSISVPFDMGFSLIFDTFSGYFKSSLPFTAYSTDSGADISATVGDGAQQVSVSTSSGNLNMTAYTAP